MTLWAHACLYTYAYPLYSTICAQVLQLNLYFVSSSYVIVLSHIHTYAVALIYLYLCILLVYGQCTGFIIYLLVTIYLSSTYYLSPCVVWLYTFFARAFHTLGTVHVTTVRVSSPCRLEVETSGETSQLVANLSGKQPTVKSMVGNSTLQYISLIPLLCAVHSTIELG